MMTPYGTPPPYMMYPPGGMYPHPSMPPVRKCTQYTQTYKQRHSLIFATAYVKGHFFYREQVLIAPLRLLPMETQMAM